MLTTTFKICSAAKANKSLQCLFWQKSVWTSFFFNDIFSGRSTNSIFQEHTFGLMTVLGHQQERDCNNWFDASGRIFNILYSIKRNVSLLICWHQLLYGLLAVLMRSDFSRTTCTCYLIIWLIDFDIQIISFHIQVNHRKF